MKKKIAIIARQLAALGYVPKQIGSEIYKLEKKNRKSFYDDELEDDEMEISFELSELAHCCGVNEIGNVTIEANISSLRLDDNRKTKKLAHLFFQWVFLNEKQSSLKSSGRGKALKKGVGIIYNGNGRGWSKHIGKALLELSDDYVVATKFININSGNTITMFVSK